MLATAEVWGHLGPERLGGEILLSKRGEDALHSFLDALYAGDTLYAFSAFPVLHVSALPGGQICAMNKIAAKLRMKMYDNMIICCFG